MSERAIFTEIYDELLGDACLRPLLDAFDQETHGVACDQPVTTENRRPIRRFFSAEPGDFDSCILAVSHFDRDQPDRTKRRGQEEWFFRVHGYAQQTVTRGTETLSGDLHLMDVRDAVVRILGWEQTRLVCPGPIVINRKWHDATVLRISWNAPLGVFEFQEQFVWDVTSRGPIAV